MKKSKLHQKKKKKKQFYSWTRSILFMGMTQILYKPTMWVSRICAQTTPHLKSASHPCCDTPHRSRQSTVQSSVTHHWAAILSLLRHFFSNQTKQLLKMTCRAFLLHLLRQCLMFSWTLKRQVKVPLCGRHKHRHRRSRWIRMVGCLEWLIPLSCPTPCWRPLSPFLPLSRVLFECHPE